jgi:hypothetical protein
MTEIIPKKSPSRRGSGQASSILRSEVKNLLVLIDRVKAVSEDKDSFKDVLDLLEGISRTSTRLVTLLKAEKELTNGQSKSEALVEAATRLVEARRRKSSQEKGGKKEAEDNEPPG